MPSIHSANILVALFLLVSGNNRRSSPLFSFSRPTALSLLCLSVSGAPAHSIFGVGGFAIGVNGLGRMKRCVPLSETTICFVGDQCGDPVRDDGLMSRHETITVTGEQRHATVSLLP